MLCVDAVEVATSALVLFAGQWFVGVSPMGDVVSIVGKVCVAVACLEHVGRHIGPANVGRIIRCKE